MECLLCACVLGGITQGRVAAQTLGEVEATKRFCESGPELRAARAARLASSAHEAAASVLPNPSLVVEHQRALTGDTDHETVLGVSVPLGFSGRRSLLREAAAERGEQASSEAEATLFEGAIAFREVYLRAMLDRARLGVLTEQQAVLDALSTTIAGLTKGGEAAEYDLLRQRLQAQLHRRVLESARAHAAASHALLDAWIGTEVSLPSIALLELAGGASTDRAHVDDAPSLHPDLRTLEAEARASALELRAAHRLWVPELELFAGYRGNTLEDSTNHGVALSLRVPLTFFDHGQAEAARATADRERALASAESLQRRYSARARALSSQLEVLNASVATAEATAGDASSLQHKARQLYAAGEATLTELIDALRATEEARLGVIDVQEEIVMTRLARMQAAGTQLDAVLDKACGAARGRNR